jgi:hypothetical protein
MDTDTFILKGLFPFKLFEWFFLTLLIVITGSFDCHTFKDYGNLPAEDL